MISIKCPHCKKEIQFKRYKVIGTYLLFIVIGFILAFMIIQTGKTNNSSNHVKTGVDYIELVDNVCYRNINENTEDIFNVTYRNGWGNAYRICMLDNLNVVTTEFDCQRWRCHKKEDNYRMDSVDMEHCGGYLRTSDYKWKAVCGDDYE